jgi:hypothetical protein
MLQEEGEWMGEEDFCWSSSSTSMISGRTLTRDTVRKPPAVKGSIHHVLSPVTKTEIEVDQYLNKLTFQIIYFRRLA